MSAFERLERSGDGRRKPGLNIILTPSGMIIVSPDAYEALGSPDRVYLLYDHDGRRIGIEAAADNGAGAYKMSLSGGTTTRQCSGRRYFTHYDISWRGKLAAHMEDGVLVASLPAAGSTSVSVAARKASAA